MLILELASSSLEIALCRGRTVIATRRIDVERGDWNAAGATQDVFSLDHFSTPLQKAVAELTGGMRGAVPALILSSTPGSVTSIGACPAAAGTGPALAAARLAVASVAAFPIAEHPHAANVLHIDRPSRSRPGAAGVAAARIHTLSTADTEGHISTLTAWAESAGLKVLGVTPSEAALAVVAVHTAQHPEQARAVLWLGGQQSVLAVSVHGRVEIVRTISAGFESLIDALMRPIRRREHEASDTTEPTTLTREQARRLLTVVGVPSVDDELPELPGCTGASVLPLLQPVIQRLAVEIKQSLRFGTSEADRAGLTLLLAGEGAGVPRLAEVLSSYAGVGFSGASEAPPNRQPLVAAAAERFGQLPLLMCRAANDSRMAVGIRRGLLAGVAAAAVLLCVEAVSVFASLRKEQERLTAIKANSAGQEAMADVQDRAVRARVEATSLTNRIARTLGQSPDWSATMTVIARHAPEAVRVVDMNMSVEDKRHLCKLRGYVRKDVQHDPTVAIRAFVDSLSDSPIVENVRMGVTQRTMIRGHEAQAFELVISLVALPNYHAATDPPAAPLAATTEDAHEQ